MTKPSLQSRNDTILTRCKHCKLLLTFCKCKTSKSSDNVSQQQLQSSNRAVKFWPNCMLDYRLVPHGEPTYYIGKKS